MRSIKAFLAATFFALSICPAFAWSHGVMFPSGTLWSTLGVVDDGVTDNTAALNALPTNTTIIGDCPHGGTILVNSQWNWQSNLTIWQKPGCWIISANTGSGHYAIGDASGGVSPLSNIFYYGLQVQKTDFVTGSRVLFAWIDHFRLLNWQFVHTGGGMFLRGSDQEIAYGYQDNTVTTAGSPGIRHIGNLPKQPTTGNKPANVWIHDNYIHSGDAAFQVGQPLDVSLWTNVSSDDFLIERNGGISDGSAWGLIGIATNQTYTHTNWSISNVIYRNNNLWTNKGWFGYWLGIQGAPFTMSNISISNQTIDMSISGSVLASLQITALSGGVGSNITFDGVNFTNSFKLGGRIIGNGGISNVTVKNCTISAPVTSGFNNFMVQGASSVTVNNCTITANGGDALDLGLNDATGVTYQTNSDVITGNTLAGIGNGKNGIYVGNANLASITGNTMTQAGGATSSIGMTLEAAGANLGDPGATNNTATGNNVSAMTNNPTIVCATGQGNVVTGNTGASDCAP